MKDQLKSTLFMQKTHFVHFSWRSADKRLIEHLLQQNQQPTKILMLPITLDSHKDIDGPLRNPLQLNQQPIVDRLSLN